MPPARSIAATAMSTSASTAAATPAASRAYTIAARSAAPLSARAFSALTIKYFKCCVHIIKGLEIILEYIQGVFSVLVSLHP